MKKSTTIALWSLTIFFALSAFAYFPSVSSLLALLVVGLIIPITNWQDIFNKFIHGKIKIAIVIALALLTIFSAQPADANTTSDVTPTTAAESTIEPTADVSTEPSAEPLHVHIFSAATCTEPRMCSCGATDGYANGHNWKNATCTTPKTCTNCNETSGSTTEHNYSAGKCTSCQKSDPNYKRETMVWIPTNGGSKYHTHSGCSNMKNPEQVTKSEAESRGFTPCKRCH